MYAIRSYYDLDDGTIVGHILMTETTIEDDGKSYKSLVLAPVSVLPEYQHRRIGSQLIVAAQNKALELRITSYNVCYTKLLRE